MIEQHSSLIRQHSSELVSHSSSLICTGLSFVFDSSFLICTGLSFVFTRLHSSALASHSCAHSSCYSSVILVITLEHCVLCYEAIQIAQYIVNISRCKRNTIYCTIEKQPPEVFCKKKVFLKLSQISQENTWSESLQLY